MYKFKMVMVWTLAIAIMIGDFSVFAYAQTPVSPDELFAEGNALYKAGHFAEAKDAFYEFADKFPEDDRAAEVQYDIGLCYFRLGDYEAALGEFEKTRRDFKHASHAAEALASIATVYWKQGLYQDAANIYDQYIREYPSNPGAADVQTRLNSIKWRFSEWNKDIPLKKQLLKDFDSIIDKYRGETHLGSLAKVRKAGVMRELAFENEVTFEESLAAAQEVLTQYPNANNDVKALAKVLILEGLTDLERWDEAIEYGNSFLAEYPEQSGQTRQAAVARYFLAKAWAAKGQFENAINLQKSVFEYYDNVDVFEYHNEGGSQTELERCFERMQDTHLEWANALAEKLDYRRAASVCYDFLMEYPQVEKSWKIWLDLAKQQYRMNEWRTAGLMFRDIISTDPMAPEAKEAQDWIARMVKYLPTANQQAEEGFFSYRQEGICGPFALQRALDYFEIEKSLATLVNLAQTDAEGTTVRNLRATARLSGLEAEAVSIDLDKWAQMPLPAIALTTTDNYVLILDVDPVKNELDVYGLFGRRLVKKEDFFASWDGLAILLGKTSYWENTPEQGDLWTQDSFTITSDNSLDRKGHGGDKTATPTHTNTPTITPSPEAPSGGCAGGFANGGSPYLSNVNNGASSGENNSVSSGEYEGASSSSGGVSLESSGLDSYSGNDFLYMQGDRMRPGVASGVETVGLASADYFYRTPGIVGAGGAYIGVTLSYDSSLEDVTSGERYFGPLSAAENDLWTISADAFLYWDYDNNNDLVFYKGGEYERSMNYLDGMWFDDVHAATASTIWVGGKWHYLVNLPSGATIRYSYDTCRINKYRNSNGVNVIYEYDANGHLYRMRLPSEDGRYIQFNWDEVNNLEDILYPDGSYIDFSYDSYGALTGITPRDSSGTQMGGTRFEYHSTSKLLEKVYYCEMSGGTATYNLAAQFTITWNSEKEKWEATDMDKRGDSQYAYAMEEIADASPGSFRRIRPDDSIYEMKIYADDPDVVTRFGYYNPQETPVGPVHYKRREDVYDTIQCVTDGLGNVTTYDYGFEVEPQAAFHELRQLRKVTQPLGNYTEFIYSASDTTLNKLGAPTQVNLKDAYGSIVSSSTYGFNNVGRLTSTGIIDATGTEMLAEMRLEYDSYGNVVATTNGEGETKCNEYNDRGQLAKTWIGEATTEFQYDVMGRKTKVISPEGRTGAYEYQGYGNLIKAHRLVDSTTYTSQFDYNSDGYGALLTASIDAKGKKLGYEYDDSGKLTAKNIYSGTDSGSYSLVTSATFDYDIMDRLVWSKDRLGNFKEYDYNYAGQLTKKTYYDSDLTEEASMEYVYYDDGKLQSLLNYCDEGCNDQLDYYYDANGRLTRRTANTFGDLYYSYDAADRVSAASFPLTTTEAILMEYGYDRAGQVRSVSEEGSNVANYEYDKAGCLKQINYDNGAYATYVYNATGQLDKLTNKDSSGETVTSFEYTYDLDGLITNIERETGDNMVYEFDDLGRLTSESRESVVRSTNGSSGFTARKVVGTGSGLDISGGDTLTMECWFKAEDVDNWTENKTILQLNQYGNHGMIKYLDDYGRFYAKIMTNVQQYNLFTGPSTFPTDGKWHHVALVWKNNYMKLYLDGSQIGSSVSTSGTLWQATASDYFYVGAGQSGYQVFEGDIDEVRISSNDRYSGSFEPRTHFNVDDTETLLLWHLNETTGSGTTAYDSSGNSFDGSFGSASTDIRTEWYRDYSFDEVDNRTQLVKNDGVEDVTVSYSYNTLHQLTEESWTEGVTAKVNYYDYDLAGRLISKEEVAGGVRSASWGYDWDIHGHMEKITKLDSDGASILYTIEYEYCISCNGARKERIKRDAVGDVVSWLRYEEQGDSTWRIDEKYDSDDDNDIDANDGWRHKQYTATGPNGELVREVMFTYASETASVPSSTDEYYYGYDRIASVMNIYDSDGQVITGGIFEQDAYGNEMNTSWLDDFKRHFGGHTWEEDEGLYHSGSAYDSRMGSTTGGQRTSRPPGFTPDPPKVRPTPVPGYPPPDPPPTTGSDGTNWGDEFFECLAENGKCLFPDEEFFDDLLTCLGTALGGGLVGIGNPVVGIGIIVFGCAPYGWEVAKMYKKLFDLISQCAEEANTATGGDSEEDNDRESCPLCITV